MTIINLSNQELINLLFVIYSLLIANWFRVKRNQVKAKKKQMEILEKSMTPMQSMFDSMKKGKGGLR